MKRRAFNGNHAAIGEIDRYGYLVSFDRVFTFRESMCARYTSVVGSDKLRKDKLSNTDFKTYDDIVEKTCEAWRFFAANRSIVTSITQREWATVKRSCRWY